MVRLNVGATKHQLQINRPGQGVEGALAASTRRGVLRSSWPPAGRTARGPVDQRTRSKTSRRTGCGDAWTMSSTPICANAGHGRPSRKASAASVDSYTSTIWLAETLGGRLLP